jgi:tRNA threonylcarbamoyladenosine biosynthesis protein TsaB
MGYILGIDTSSVELGIGLVKDLRPVMSVSRYLRNSHAEHITQCIDFLLETNSIPASEITAAGIAVGPGSFTGLRIGIAFLKGFFFGREAKVLPISSLESMAGAWNVNGKHVVAASDARNNQVFWARFKSVQGTVTRMTDDILSSLDNFKSCLADDDIVMTDTLGYAKSAAFDFLVSRPDTYSVEKNPIARGLSCGTIASQRLEAFDLWRTPADIAPIYMNTSFAEKKKTGSDTV